MIRVVGSVLMAAVISCDTIVTPTQVVTVPAPGAPAASPAAVPLVPGVVDQVVVETFEATCPGPTSFVVGCIARITATPKAHGVMVGPEVHGVNCNWFLDGSPITGVGATAAVQVSRTPNAFNVNAVALAPGSFRLEAEVMGIRGQRNFTVQ